MEHLITCHHGISSRGIEEALKLSIHRLSVSEQTLLTLVVLDTLTLTTAQKYVPLLRLGRAIPASSADYVP